MYNAVLERACVLYAMKFSYNMIIADDTFTRSGIHSEPIYYVVLDFWTLVYPHPKT